MALLSSASVYSTLGFTFGHVPASTYHEATLAGNIALDATYPSMLKLDPDGSARDVTLDAEEDIPSTGLVRHIVNSAGGAENLVLKDDGGSTIATVNQNEEAIVVNAGVQDGTASAWSLVRIATIALS